MFENLNIRTPYIPDFATNNAHMYYLICEDKEYRDRLISYLKSSNIQAVFHYLSLHASPFYASKHDSRALLNSDFYSDNLLRLPFSYDLSQNDLDRIITAVKRAI